jgi:PEP-CTERM motif-containing protein
MRVQKTLRGAIYAAFIVVGAGPFGSGAKAQIPYPTPGVQNTQAYGIVAAKTGNLNVWFGGNGGASDEDVITALVNGVPTGILGPDNQTAILGQYFNLGHVTGGDSIIFKMTDLSAGNTWYTDNARNFYLGNPDGNHAYAAYFGGGLVGSTVVPSSLYIGFEDIPSPFADFNYTDAQIYVRTDAIPEPSTWAMMLLGFAGLGLMYGRTKRRFTALAAV